MFEGFVGLKIPPFTPKKFVVGMEDSEINGLVTARGRRFFSQLVNLFQGTTFGSAYPDENSDFSDLASNTRSIMEKMFPGLDFNVSADKSQYINYWDSASHQRIWAETDQVDFDADGAADAGLSIDDGVPYFLYLNGTSTFSNKDGSDSIDFSRLWGGVRANLPGVSYGQIIGSGSYEGMDTESGFGLLLGLLQLKRNYVYAFQMLGLNANNPNSDGAIDMFNNVINSWQIKETGNYNNQLLWHYFNLRPTVAQRLREWMGAAGAGSAGYDFYNWIKNTILPDYKENINRARIGAVDVNRDQVWLSGLNDLINALEGNIDPSTGKLIVPEGEDIETVASRVSNYINSIRIHLNRIQEIQQGIGQEFGIVPGALLSKLNNLQAAIASWSTPSVIDGETNFSQTLSELNALHALAFEIDNSEQQIFDNPDSVIDMLFREFSVESDYSSPSINHLSSDQLGEDMRGTVKGAFELLNRRPVGHVVGIMSVNIGNIQQNKRIDRKENEKKQEQFLEKLQDAKADAKRAERQRAERAENKNRVKPKERKEKVSKK